jgi:hypothetical protein
MDLEHQLSDKAQQDFLLPYVENGTILLIGATTENPSFEVISALLSRSRVFVLNRLDERMIEIISTAIQSNSWGFSDRVKIGHYASKDVFYTLLFHEVSHALLNRTDLNAAALEYACWDFSRKICRQLALPYSVAKEYLNKFWLEIFNRIIEKGIKVHPFEIIGSDCWREIDFHGDIFGLIGLLEKMKSNK